MLTEYQKFIHKSRYARYLDSESRRETWGETVQRYAQFWTDKGMSLPPTVVDSILKMDVVPSMRALMTAGPALERDNMAGYNCAFIAIDHIRAFDENLYTLLCGTGVGFSVERQFIAKLPEVAESFHETDTTIIVRDSKIGWAKALRELISLLYQGSIPEIDYSKIRPSGARLKTFGGRASGPDPLKKLFTQYIRVFKHAKGRRLTSIECHDLLCFNGEAVVVGGVRRAAELSLSNLTDERMQRAKMGQWWIEEPQRALANNSVCYTEKPDMGIFMREFLSLYESKSGERGIFNRTAAKKMAPERRDDSYEFGCNPCSEVILRSCGLCNLSEVILRPDDTIAIIKKKIRHATILGTYQSTLTNFRYVRPVWKKNAEEERLLGVSLTGIFDCLEISSATPDLLEELKQVAVKTNKEYANKLGINQSVAVTCVKPSGTVSQLAGVSGSGLHPSYSDYYIRRVRQDKKDPLNQALVSAGVPYIVDPYNSEALVFEFPMRAPKNSVTRHKVTALEHLEIWKRFAVHWSEHKPSVTIYTGEDEWLEVGAWLYKNFDILSGISILPKADEDHSYEATPYEEITMLEYNDMFKKFPKQPIDWDVKEIEDNTTGSQELACTADACEI
jgi:ribonucleoside-diphosphate reductase alpha chain|tara:strand:- start:800 stop:2656 length:1857 start_codon:yes stop_codon:yes gene_type:complete